MITLLIVDDQPGTRRGLRMRLELEPDVAILGEAGDGATAVELTKQLHPDVVLMDVEMPGMDGIAATAAIRSVEPRAHVVILTLYDDNVTQARARAAGAHAFVPKHRMEEPLLAAIRGAACGCVG